MDNASEWFGLLLLTYIAICTGCGLWAMNILEKRNRSGLAGFGLGMVMGLAGVLIAFVVSNERR